MAIPTMKGLAQTLGLGQKQSQYEQDMQQRHWTEEMLRQKYEAMKNHYANQSYSGGGVAAGEWVTSTSNTIFGGVELGLRPRPRPPRPSPADIAAKANNDPAMAMPIEQCLLLLKAKFEGWYSLAMVHDGDDAATIVTLHNRCHTAGLLETVYYEGHDLHRPKEL